QFNNISDINSLGNLTNLKFLNLEGNNITEFMGWENLTNLKRLNLENNPIDFPEKLDSFIDALEAKFQDCGVCYTKETDKVCSKCGMPICNGCQNTCGSCDMIFCPNCFDFDNPCPNCLAFGCNHCGGMARYMYVGGETEDMLEYYCNGCGVVLERFPVSQFPEKD
ncbi:MAG: hypothetical protein ACTSVZ_09320, partial [Promethearchaeota archaeon]